MKWLRPTPAIYEVQNLFNMLARNDSQAGLPDGRYVPARPLGFQSWHYRLRATWLVFTGRADAVTWEGQ